MQESERPGILEPRRMLRGLLAALYAVAGILHLAYPSPFLMITPDWVPYPHLVILLTGLCEIAGAFGLLVPALRKPAGLGLAIYAVAVFPANVKHMMLDLGGHTPALGLWYHLPRLALQPLLVWMALYATSLMRWPMRA